jgi:hypothetical protein
LTRLARATTELVMAPLADMVGRLRDPSRDDDVAALAARRIPQS